MWALHHDPDGKVFFYKSFKGLKLFSIQKLFYVSYNDIIASPIMLVIHYTA